MIEVITSRLLNWYSLTLLILLIGSVFSVVNLMLQERKNVERSQDLPIGVLIAAVLEKAPEGNLSILVLMGSSYLLYCQVLGLSRGDELNLTTFFLNIGGAIFSLFIFACAARISKWMNSGNLEK